MLKALGRTSQGKVLFLGLSHENLDRLRRGQPIEFDLAQFQGAEYVVIFSGPTTEAMSRELLETCREVNPGVVVHTGKDRPFS